MSSWFAERIEPGERILWEGRPDKRRFVVGPSDIFMIPFSLLWGGFAIFWETAVWATPAPLLFRLWGIPFVLIGLYLICGRFLVAAAAADRTHYAVTDRRVLLASGLLSQSVEELSLKRLPYLQLSEGRGGFGSIFFTLPGAAGWMAESSFAWPGYARHAVGFRAIADAANVYRTIERARDEVDR